MTEELPRLVDALETALADMVEASRGSAEALGMIETALADALGRLEARGAIDLEPLVAALNNLRPVVNVTVPPLQIPAPTVHMMPAAEFQVTLHDAFGRPERSMTIKRVAAAT